MVSSIHRISRTIQLETSTFCSRRNRMKEDLERYLSKTWSASRSYFIAHVIILLIHIQQTMLKCIKFQAGLRPSTPRYGYGTRQASSLSILSGNLHGDLTLHMFIKKSSNTYIRSLNTSVRSAYPSLAETGKIYMSKKNEPNCTYSS